MPRGPAEGGQLAGTARTVPGNEVAKPESEPGAGPFTERGAGKAWDKRSFLGKEV